MLRFVACCLFLCRDAVPTLPIASLVNLSTGQLGMVGPSGPHHAARINQLLPLELLKSEAGESAVIDEQDDDGSSG